MNELIINEKTFDDIKHIDEDGNEFWYARELMKVLEYKEWRYFIDIIDKAKVACIGSNSSVEYHFGVCTKTIEMPKNATKDIIDYKLSRYACYLIVQNANPKYKTVAIGQTYFAIQTRKQEVLESIYKDLPEDKKRLKIRSDIKTGNYSLNQAALDAGVRNFDKFHNAGYKGLYGGETADDIAKRKGIRYREEILDNMCSEELIANEFRIIQTEAKIRRDKIDNEYDANSAHYNIGKIVRNAIKEAKGTMPENLPTPNKSIKEIENKKNVKLDKKM